MHKITKSNSENKKFSFMNKRSSINLEDKRIQLLNQYKLGKHAKRSIGIANHEIQSSIHNPKKIMLTNIV